MTFLLEPPRQRIAPAAMASAMSHLAAAAIAVVLTSVLPGSRANRAAQQGERADKIVWLSDQRSGRGGGGSGGNMPQPPRRAEMPGRDAITVPVAMTRSPDAAADREPDPVRHLTIPAIPTAAGVESLIGAIDAPPAPSLSLGPGRGGETGAGIGHGDGPGIGPGQGSGRGGNEGDGVFQPGGPGISLPYPISEVKPQYTADAMRARVQGTVLLACVVREDGMVGQVRVIRSLDQTFGLDERAIAAAKLWRFRPGTRMGVPVPVQVTIELTFTIR